MLHNIFKAFLHEHHADFIDEQIDEQKQTLILNIRCHIMHEKGLATVYSMIPNVVRDQALVGFGCDTVRICALTQKHHTSRYGVDNRAKPMYDKY